MTINAKGRSERIFADLEAMYPTPEIAGSELCSEELMAAEKGWLDMNWEPEISHVVVDQENERFDVFVGVEEMLPEPEPLSRSFQEKLVIARDPPMVDENGVAIEPPKHGRGRRIKTMEVNETQISEYYIPIRLSMANMVASQNQTLVSFCGEEGKAESQRRAYHDFPYQGSH